MEVLNRFRGCKRLLLQQGLHCLQVWIVITPLDDTYDVAGCGLKSRLECVNPSVHHSRVEEASTHKFHSRPWFD